jgi:hypothetical protein
MRQPRQVDILHVVRIALAVAALGTTPLSAVRANDLRIQGGAVERVVGSGGRGR